MVERTHLARRVELFLMPSFYGLSAWCVWLGLYWMRLVPLDRAGFASNSVFVGVVLGYLCSMFFQAEAYRKHCVWFTRSRVALDARVSAVLLVLLHAVGIAGIVKYIFDFASAMGGVERFLIILGTAPDEIRAEAESTTSIGTTLGYAGWIAVGLSVIAARRGGRRLFWLFPCFLQMLGNLLYIDRTRPIWIAFAASLMVVGQASYLRVRRLMGIGLSIAVASIVVFVGLGWWSGKVSNEAKFGASVLPAQLQDVYFYGASGFAYFDRMTKEEKEHSYIPIRLIYPVAQLSAKLGLSSYPPSQINQFYSVPFDTNVGTFLEPFYRDGGFSFVVLGILIYGPLLDWVGLFLLRSGTLLARFAWANLCFCTFIGFFTPKIASSPLWLFCLIGGLSALGGRRRRIT